MIDRPVRQAQPMAATSVEGPRPVVDEQQFVRLFGARPGATARACGRVNLIGEHTDYSGGLVLPSLIPQAAVAAVAPGSGRRVRAWSRELSEPSAVIEYRLGEESSGRGWVDYVQGITAALHREGFSIDGFDLWLASDVPLGSGLSSSAALEVALLRALRTLFALPFDDVTLARLGRAAETEFVGVPIGIMDQMASSLAPPGGALFIDTRSLDTEAIPLPPSVELVVIDSGVAHNHAHGDYRTRRAECERAAALLGVTELRDVSVAELTRLATLPAPLDRRARHVVTENQRVRDAVQAMRAGDARALGALFTSSHQSQRDDYECSVPEVDRLVELALAETAVFGARLTGGGFGGSMVALARAGAGAAVAARVVERFTSERAGRPAVLLP